MSSGTARSADILAVPEKFVASARANGPQIGAARPTTVPSHDRSRLGRVTPAVTPRLRREPVLSSRRPASARADRRW
jgi:hypothetical protein